MDQTSSLIPLRANNRRRTESHPTYVVLDFPAGVGIDGEPSLLVLGLDVGVLGGQGVLDLQASRHAGHLAVAGVCQHSGQFHQEGRLGREEGSAPTLPAPTHPPPRQKCPQPPCKTTSQLTEAPSLPGQHQTTASGSIPRLRVLSS